ncbi:MAG TPA: hypothetical protein PKJ63_07225, partial [Cyclobacteriaceae bacterium]|nr:hypothetical protein [Cyclobacteriaceae bacterium]
IVIDGPWNLLFGRVPLIENSSPGANVFEKKIPELSSIVTEADDAPLYFNVKPVSPPLQAPQAFAGGQSQLWAAIPLEASTRSKKINHLKDPKK